MFSHFKFQVRENARDDIDNFERSRYHSWRKQEMIFVNLLYDLQKTSSSKE